MLKIRPKRSPRTLIFAITLLAIGFLFSTFRQDLAMAMYRNAEKTGPFVVMSVFFFLIGGGLVLSLYLRGDIGFPFLDKFVDTSPYRTSFDAQMQSQIDGQVQRQILDLQEHVLKISEQLKGTSLGTEQLSAEQQSRLVEELRQKVQGVVANDIISQIEARYSARIAEETHTSQLRRGIEQSKSRLSEEIRSLTRRNITNLTIGIVTTGAAVILLSYLVLGATQQTFSNIPDLLAHFIPRVSVAAFIEVFSFFFLRLYKSGLDQIKYFQNELTNVEMKSLAIESALSSGHNKMTEKIIPQLISVDRNIPGTGMTAGDGGGKQLNPKDLADIIDKLGKLVRPE